MTRQNIRAFIAELEPFDQLEQDHIADALAWIDTGSPIFRIAKPDKPPKHLVSYFVPYDREAGKLLLVDHKNAQLLLPPGGHVEPNEDPIQTVMREAKEELGMVLTNEDVASKPLFITVTVTVGLTSGHTDVSLWYLVDANSNSQYFFDGAEFLDYKWLALDEVQSLPISKLDPHLHRFVRKLKEAC